MASILSLLDDFTAAQYEAVENPGTDMVATAGAGSGKTRMLVGRYLGLLESGLPPRSVVAITFTDKAAREMRTRIRQYIEEWLSEGHLRSTTNRSGDVAGQAEDDGTATTSRSRWHEIYTELDAAPIGTIHSLCATILRTRPVEAGVDPAFQVLDEGHAAALRAAAVEEALVWAANDPGAAGLFSLLPENGLRQAVSFLLDRRLDAGATFDAVGADPLPHWRAELEGEIASFLDHPDVRAAARELATLRADGTLAESAGDTLAGGIGSFLGAWDAIGPAWEAGDLATVLDRLPEARRAMQPRKGRKGNWGDIELPRRALSALRAAYEAHLGGLLRYPVDWALDERAAAALPHLRAVFNRARKVYAQAKDLRQALDFDDLEAGAVAVLEDHPSVSSEWRDRVRAVLVDEFQDTNDRQRRIVFALVGDRGVREPAARTPAAAPAAAGLFVVGDAKQSIYRFRGADVAVFRRVQRDIAAAGGRVVELDRTFRAHEALVRRLNALLEPAMAIDGGDERPYVVPFAPLSAWHKEPRQAVREPYVELCLGVGENADEGRTAAAGALAGRLWQLHDEEEISWRDIGLLFRASNGFPAYEDALEGTGIPYVTVAGRGFYDRPEVRDLLNALRAITDPADDRALVGFLRSPAFALTDGATYLLRRGEDGAKRSVWAALHGDLSSLGAEDSQRAVRARRVLSELNGLAGRATVADVLKRLLDETNYVAILCMPHRGAAGPGRGGGRARRNVEKLLADAHASRLVSIGEFLEYLQTLRDVGAREGEAPVEAGNAVQLMTVHKAKGLQFPVVVIADAARQPGGGSARLLLDDELGPVVNLGTGGGGRSGARSLVHRLAALREADKGDAEERRLLYVAATRAMEKLLISGHVTIGAGKDAPGKLSARGWLKQLGEIVGLDSVRIEDPPFGTMRLDLPDLGGGPVGCSISPPPPVDSPEPPELPGAPRPSGSAPGPRRGPSRAREAPDLPSGVPPDDVVFPPPLVEPIVAPPVVTMDETQRARDARPPRRAWRVVPTAKSPEGPAWVVGSLVHEALRRWHFPGDGGFDDFLRLHALDEGLTDEAEIEATLRDARGLLDRFQEHELYDELAGAERQHEVPYSVRSGDRTNNGVIDVLYRHEGRWHVVDFKTDRIRDEDELRAKVAEHEGQVRVYAAAVEALLGERPVARLCFLDANRRVRLEWVE